MEEKRKNNEGKEEEKISRVPDYKKKIVSDLANKIKESKTVLVASTKGLPGNQFHQIKKKLRGRAEVLVAKKSLFLRAVDSVKKGALNNIKGKIGADVAIFFSGLDAFELSALLSDNESPTKAKAGDIAPEDIKVEPGPTELMPGPAISELGAVGLKVAVENGKLAIKQGATLVKEGEEINEKVAGVLSKLGITPMKVGFEPVAAYSASDDKTYLNVKIDKEGTLEALREAIGKSLNFSVNIGYVNVNNIGFFIAKGGAEAAALEKLVEKPVEEEKEEKVSDGNVKTDEGVNDKKDENGKIDESKDNKDDEGEKKEEAKEETSVDNSQKTEKEGNE